jgi:sortase (surface protein transpeptidase)
MKRLAQFLVLVGVLILIDVGITLVWQEPLSALYAKYHQGQLSGRLHQIERTEPKGNVEALARALEYHARDGSPVGRIYIPRLNARYVVVKGTSTSDLDSGPGIYPQTSVGSTPTRSTIL